MRRAREGAVSRGAGRAGNTRKALERRGGNGCETGNRARKAAACESAMAADACNTRKAHGTPRARGRRRVFRTDGELGPRPARSCTGSARGHTKPKPIGPARHCAAGRCAEDSVRQGAPAAAGVLSENGERNQSSARTDLPQGRLLSRYSINPARDTQIAGRARRQYGATRCGRRRA